MNKWFVALEGEKSDLQDLADLEPSGWKVSQEDRQFYLTSDSFDALDLPATVREFAEGLLSLVNGAARIQFDDYGPVEVGHIRRVRGDGFVEIQTFDSINLSIRGKARFSATVTSAAGTVKRDKPVNEVGEWVQIAMQDREAEKALRLYGSLPQTWRNLYLVLEVVLDSCGGKKNLAAKRWMSKNKIDLFKRTANSFHVIRTDARHSSEKRQPPSKPMSLEEAQALVRRLLRKWLDLKSART